MCTLVYGLTNTGGNSKIQCTANTIQQIQAVNLLRTDNKNYNIIQAQHRR